MNLWRIENGKVHLSLHHGQARAWRSQRRFVFIIAGTQGGKTSFGPWWLHRETQRCGQGDYIAATASYDLFKLKLLPEIRQVFEHTLKIGRFWAADKIIEIRHPQKGFLAKRATDPMWARIILRSAQSSGGLESATAKAALLDECGQDGFTLEDWEAVLRRLSLNQGRVLGATTPYNLGWIKTEIHDAWVDGDKDIDVIRFASIVNPRFPKEEFERAKNKMQDWRFKMFYLGEFARPVGLIYGAFTDDMLVDPFPVPPEWRRIVGLDFGGANQASLWLAQNPQDMRWYAFRETLEGGLTTKEHAREAASHKTERTEFVGGAPSESQQRRDWAAAGIFVRQPSVTDVESGIDRVSELIKTDKFRVFKNLVGLRDELGSYRRQADSDGNPTNKISDKRKYHRLDCLRYGATLIRSAGWARGPI